MRHFSLMKLLAFSSFASTEGYSSQHQLQRTSTRSSSATTPPRITRGGRAHKLNQSLQLAAAKQEQLQAEFDRNSSGRRRALQAFVTGSLALVGGDVVANALDMDSFINSELAADTKNCDPKKDSKCISAMSADEALCKYGQSGQARADACKRFRASGGAPPTKGSEGKSLGGAYAI